MMKYFGGSGEGEWKEGLIILVSVKEKGRLEVCSSNIWDKNVLNVPRELVKRWIRTAGIEVVVDNVKVGS